MVPLRISNRTASLKYGAYFFKTTFARAIVPSDPRGERDTFPFSSAVSPASVEKDISATAFFPVSVPRPSTSTRIPPNFVSKGIPLEVSENLTFPPESRMESTVNFCSFPSGCSLGAFFSPFSSVILSVCFSGTKDIRFNFPLRSREMSISGS